LSANALRAEARFSSSGIACTVVSASDKTCGSFSTKAFKALARRYSSFIARAVAIMPYSVNIAASWQHHAHPLSTASLPSSY
jgi:hypothetical protein